MDYCLNPSKDFRLHRFVQPEHPFSLDPRRWRSQTQLTAGRTYHSVTSPHQPGRAFRADKAGHAGNEYSLHHSARDTCAAIRIALAITVKLWFFEGNALKFAASAM